MFTEEESNILQALDCWFYSPQGIHVANAFRKKLEAIIPLISGDRLIQLGTCGQNLWLSQFHHSKKWILSPDTFLASDVISSYHHLALQRESVDCIIVPFILDTLNLSKPIISEIDRVLKPMGHVIFLGVNPLSLWGLFLRFKPLSWLKGFSSKSLSAFFIKRLLLQFDYQQVRLLTFYALPPFTKEIWLQRFIRLEEIGKIIWPYPSGFYCLVAQKYQKKFIIPPLRVEESLLLNPSYRLAIQRREKVCRK